MDRNRQRTCALLVAAGICILLARTVIMLASGSLREQVAWVAALLVVEFLLNTGTLLSAIGWAIAGTGRWASIPLRLAAGAVAVHAVRVLIYVLGRTGPWHEFDLRPAFRTGAPPEWTWVVFAAVMASLGLAGALVVWRARQRARRGASSEPGG